VYGALWKTAKTTGARLLFPELDRASGGEVDQLDIDRFTSDVARHRRLLASVPGRLYARCAALLDPAERNLLQQRQEMFFTPGIENIPYDYEIDDGAAERDEYLVSDVYELDDRYDLVTSCFAMEYFDLEKIFAKVSRMLTGGGVFAFLTNFWWYPVNGSKIIGLFPYACQRLTFEDLERYYEQCHPGELGDMRSCYNYSYGQMRTTDDYVQVAAAHDLECRCICRIAPRRLFDHKLGERKIAPDILDQFEDGGLESVLRDVRHFKPAIGMEDLKTSHVIMAFVKRG
jgi:SAM-dependent methyltransferase